MSPVPVFPKPPRRVPSTASLRYLVTAGVRLYMRFAFYFFWAMIIPAGGAYLIVLATGAYSGKPDKSLAEWGVVFFNSMVPHALYMAACLRILFYSGRGLTLLGVTLGWWELRLTLFQLIAMLMNFLWAKSNFWLAAWSADMPDVVYKIGVWGIWGVFKLFLTMHFLALCYFADKEGGAFLPGIARSWRTMGYVVFPIGLVYMSFVAISYYIGEPLWFDFVLPENSSITRTASWAVRFYFHGSLTAIFAFLAFRHIHPDDEPLTVNRTNTPNAT